MINNQNLAVLSEKVAYLESAVKNSNEASEISYDNTDSGLTAENVQAAIDELSEASGISYDNTDSGLTADDVQGAIDEIADKSVVTPASACITDLTKVKVIKTRLFTLVSFEGAELTANVSKYGILLSDMPLPEAYVLNNIVSVSGTTETGIAVYVNANQRNVQANSALTSGVTLWGSLLYMNKE